MDKKDVGRLLYCSSVLEEAVAKAYKTLSERVENPLIESMLLAIAYDSHKHSAMLTGLFKSMGEFEVKKSDCEKLLGQAWKKLVAFSEIATMKEGKVEEAGIISLVDKMIDLENFVGEEYLMRLDLKVIQLIAKDLEADSTILKWILDRIVEEEKAHEEILLMVKDLASKKKKK